MGIRFFCEHCCAQLNVKAHQAGQQGVCPNCDHDIRVPEKSTVLSKRETASKKRKKAERRARQKAIDAEQKTMGNSGANQEFDEWGTESSNTQRAAAKPLAAEANSSQETISAAQSQAPTFESKENSAQGKGNFLLDKPTNPWLQPNAPDPIDSGIEKIWYIRDPDHGEEGPIKGKEIPRLLADKRIFAGCFVWREDWEDWIRAELVFRELQPVAGPPTDDRLFSDPNCPIPKAYRRKANAKHFARKRKRTITVVAIVLGLVTISLLAWLLSSLW